MCIDFLVTLLVVGLILEKWTPSSPISALTVSSLKISPVSNYTSLKSGIHSLDEFLKQYSDVLSEFDFVFMLKWLDIVETSLIGILDIIDAENLTSIEKRASEINQLMSSLYSNIDANNHFLEFNFGQLSTFESIHLDPSTLKKFKASTMSTVTVSQTSMKRGDVDVTSISSVEGFSSGTHKISFKYNGFQTRDRSGAMRVVGVHGDPQNASAVSYQDKLCFGVYVTLPTCHDNYIVNGGRLMEVGTLHVSIGSRLILELDCDRKILIVTHEGELKWKRQISLPSSGPWHFHFNSYSVDFSIN